MNEPQSPLLERIRSLRDQALEDLKITDAYLSFRLLDDEVVGSGGRSIWPSQYSAAISELEEFFPSVPKLRVFRGDLAYAAVIKHGSPLSLRDLFSHSGETDPARLPSFRVTLSNDPRFVNLKREKKTYWWSSRRPIPTEWQPE